MARSYPRARSADVLFEMIAHELVVYDLASKKAHCLNRTAASVSRRPWPTRSDFRPTRAWSDTASSNWIDADSWTTWASAAIRSRRVAS